jgi:hypothetical protein
LLSISLVFAVLSIEVTHNLKLLSSLDIIITVLRACVLLRSYMQVLTCPAVFWTSDRASQNEIPKTNLNLGTKLTTPTVGVVRFRTRF